MDTVFRITFIYLLTLVGLRIIGKREFGQLSPHEFVVLLMIPEIVSTALNQNDKSLTNAVVGITTVLALVFATSTLSHRVPAAGRFISDSPAVLVHHGKLFERVMNRERVTPDEILAEARSAGIDRLEDVRWAVLEADGKIAIVPEDPASDVNPSDDKKLG